MNRRGILGSIFLFILIVCLVIFFWPSSTIKHIAKTDEVIVNAAKTQDEQIKTVQKSIDSIRAEAKKARDKRVDTLLSVSDDVFLRELNSYSDLLLRGLD